MKTILASVIFVLTSLTTLHLVTLNAVPELEYGDMEDPLGDGEVKTSGLSKGYVIVWAKNFPHYRYLIKINEANIVTDVWEMDDTTIQPIWLRNYINEIQYGKLR